MSQWPSSDHVRRCPDTFIVFNMFQFVSNNKTDSENVKMLQDHVRKGLLF